MSRHTLFASFSQLLMFAVASLTSSTAFSQTATETVNTRKSLSYTFDNATGFSISNNGTLNYKGPLNEATKSTCCSNATLSALGQTINITSDEYEKDTGFRSNSKSGTTLSSRLSEATIDIGGQTESVGLEYTMLLVALPE